MTDLRIEVSDTVSISESLTARTESYYLIGSNKDKVRQILSKPDLSDEDIIDALIDLHLVLEVGLNSFYRNLSLLSIKKQVDEFEVIKNIDSINFIDKTVLFIYNSKFNFDGRMGGASTYHSVIGKLKNFSELRNLLLHGHSISSMFADKTERHSQLKKKINKETLDEQIKKFREILEGMRFYFDCLDSTMTDSGKASFKKEYLDDSFLN